MVVNVLKVVLWYEVIIAVSTRNTWLPNYLVTWLPSYLVTWLPGYLVTWLPGYLVTWLAGLLRFLLPRYSINLGG